MLVLLTLAFAALPVQIEEISDVEPAVEAILFDDLARALTHRTGEAVQILDCRSKECAQKDAAGDTERLHVLIFGGPTRISVSGERVGRGRALRASSFIPNDSPDRRQLLERWAAELYPDLSATARGAAPEVIAVAQSNDDGGRSGPRALTVGSLIVSGLALAGAVTFGIMARSAQSDLADKPVYDDEVRGLESDIGRNTGIALGLLGGGVAAGIVAIVAEAID